jgi:hypothetical protein
MSADEAKIRIRYKFKVEKTSGGGGSLRHLCFVPWFLKLYIYASYGGVNDFEIE